MTLVTPNEYIQVSGKVEIMVAVPLGAYELPQWPFNPVRTVATTPTTGVGAYAALMKLGESADFIEPQRRNIVGGVKGDRYGGNEGGDIEKQAFGFSYDIPIEMTRWDPEVLVMMECMGGLFPGGDIVPLSSVGSLILLNNSFRLLLYSLIDARFIHNFPCCTMEQPRKFGVGTKHSKLSIMVAAERAPEGHWAAPASGTDLVTGYVKNRDFTGFTPPV